MEDTILKVENLSISFTQYVKGLERRDLKVISNLDLEVKKGEIVAIVGSSGSGKSLLAHAILGILPENATLEGGITYMGETLTEERKAALRGKEICLIPQSVNYIDPLMQAGRFVQLSVPNDKEEAKRRQRKVFEEYNLAEEVDSMYPFQLSGGMTRRVLVSTAAIMENHLIIADEPTPGLDEEALNETLNLFKGLRDKGASIVIITHDIQAALKIADRIAIFYAGTTLEIANREDFEGSGERLRHPYTKALWLALPENGFHVLDGSQPSPTQLPKGCLFAERCEFADENCKKSRPDFEQLHSGHVRCIKATLMHEHPHEHDGIAHTHKHMHFEGDTEHVS